MEQKKPFDVMAVFKNFTPSVVGSIQPFLNSPQPIVREAAQKVQMAQNALRNKQIIGQQYRDFCNQVLNVNGIGANIQLEDRLVVFEAFDQMLTAAMGFVP